MRGGTLSPALTTRFSLLLSPLFFLFFSSFAPLPLRQRCFSLPFTLHLAGARAVVRGSGSWEPILTLRNFPRSPMVCSLFLLLPRSLHILPVIRPLACGRFTAKTEHLTIAAVLSSHGSVLTLGSRLLSHSVPPAMFEKVIVIDARAHLLGRLASVVAKQLLNGKALSLRWRPLSSPSSR